MYICFNFYFIFLGNTTITGWIQGTVENRIARRIKYDLEISVGNVTAKYSDLSYGYNQSEIIIESKKECLEMIVTKPPRSMIVKLKVYRWTGVSRIGRTSETELVIVNYLIYFIFLKNILNILFNLFIGTTTIKSVN